MPINQLELVKETNNYLSRHKQPTKCPDKLKGPVNVQLSCHRGDRSKLYCGSSNAKHEIPYYDSGDFSQNCPHCQAKLLLNEEKKLDKNSWGKCCAYGDVHTKIMQNEYMVFFFLTLQIILINLNNNKNNNILLSNYYIYI